MEMESNRNITLLGFTKFLLKSAEEEEDNYRRLQQSLVSVLFPSTGKCEVALFQVPTGKKSGGNRGLFIRVELENFLSFPFPIHLISV